MSNMTAAPEVPELKRAAGILFVRGDRKILLMRRASGDYPGAWALPGGGVEEGETAAECALRETLEEAGFEYSGELIPWTRRRADGVDYTTFVGSVPDGFEPALNPEHDDCMWVDRQFALAAAPVLHPGLPIALQRFEMNELDIAKAIQAGQLSSPQRYRNLMLVALRITGTG
ncbi:MAG TPA: NUDIX hydrolase, partial [Steroidobacteraceae bacterium]